MMKKVLAVFGVAVFGFASAASAEAPPVISPSQVQVQGTAGLVLVQVPLECSGAGASDVASRKHSIKNNTGFPIPKGTVIHWTASNKGTGKVTLSSDLAPNGTVDVIEPGQTNGYSCTAGFFPGAADLAVKSVKWTGPSTAQIEIANLNPWTGANATVLRVQSLKCLASPVASVDVQVGAIAKGGSTTVSATIAHAGADYLEATANATNTISEKTKANNALKSPDFLTNKSCTPQ